MSELEIDFKFEEPVQDFSLPELSLKYDTEELPEILLGRGVTDLLIRVAGYAEYVAVDDDAEFLADAYIALVRIIKQRQDNAQHSVFLGDGRIMIKATITGTSVVCVVENYPHLRRDLGSSKQLGLSLQAYAYGWWRAIEQLMAPLTVLPS
jgi:hypothetical protein